MTDVPSNLIPTRISQLPVAPVADENSLRRSPTRMR